MMTPIATGWHRINDHHGFRLVWVEPDRPRAGWIAAWPSREVAERGNITDALLLRRDEFGRCLVQRIETAPGGSG